MYCKALVLYFLFAIFAVVNAQVVITPTIATTTTPTNTSAVATATALPVIPPCAVQCVVTAALAVGCKGM